MTTTDFEKVINKKELNAKARKYLLEHCVSKRGAEIMVFGFTGYLNGVEYEEITLIRKLGKWETFNNHETILSIKGTFDSFSMTRDTIL